MAQHWIPAPTALSLLDELSGGHVGKQALVTRARAGTLKASARLLDIEGDTKNEVVLKPAFWDWDRYSESLERWEVGDFSVVHDGLRHHAVGVHFDLLGLLELLPAERRSEFARRVSVAGSGEWMTAKAARAFTYNELGAPPLTAASVLLDQCRFGFVSGKAILRQQAREEGAEDFDIEEREWDIPLWFWERFTLPDSSSQDWERGIFSGQGRAPFGQCWIRLSGVHFLKTSLVGLLASRGAGTNTSDPQPNQQPKPPLPDAKLQSWWAAKVAVREQLSLEELLVLARGAFPENHITRDRIRSLSGPRKTGPKQFGGNTSAE